MFRYFRLVPSSVKLANSCSVVAGTSSFLTETLCAASTKTKKKTATAPRSTSQKKVPPIVAPKIKSKNEAKQSKLKKKPEVIIGEMLIQEEISLPEIIINTKDFETKELSSPVEQQPEILSNNNNNRFMSIADKKKQLLEQQQKILEARSVAKKNQLNVQQEILPIKEIQAKPLATTSSTPKPPQRSRALVCEILSESSLYQKISKYLEPEIVAKDCAPKFEIKENVQPISITALRRPVFGAELSLHSSATSSCFNFPSFSIYHQDAAKNKSLFRCALAKMILKSSASSECPHQQQHQRQDVLVRLLCSPKDAKHQASYNSREPIVFLSWFDILLSSSSVELENVSLTLSQTTATATTMTGNETEQKNRENSWTCRFAVDGNGINNNKIEFSKSSPSVLDCVLELTKAVHEHYFPSKNSNSLSTSVLHYNISVENNRFVAPSSTDLRFLLTSLINFHFGNIQPYFILTTSPTLFKNRQSFPQGFISFLSVVGLVVGNVEKNDQGARNKIVNLKNLSAILLHPQHQDPFLNQQEVLSESSLNSKKMSLIPLGFSIAPNKKHAERSALQSCVEFHFSNFDSTNSDKDEVEKTKIVNVLNQLLTEEKLRSGFVSTNENLEEAKNIFLEISSKYYGIDVSVASKTGDEGQRPQKAFFVPVSEEPNVPQEFITNNELLDQEEVALTPSAQQREPQISPPTATTTTTPTAATTPLPSKTIENIKVTKSENNNKVVSSTFSDIPHEKYIQLTPTASCLLPFWRNKANNLLSEIEDKLDEVTGDDFSIEEDIVRKDSPQRNADDDDDDNSSSFECTLFKKNETSSKREEILAQATSRSEILASFFAYRSACEKLEQTMKLKEESSLEGENTLHLENDKSVALPPNIAFSPLNLELAAKNLVHYFLGMNLEIQTFTSTSVQDDSSTATNENNIEITTSSYAVSLSGSKKYLLSKIISSELGFEEIKRLCLSKTLELISQASPELELVALDRGEKHICFGSILNISSTNNNSNPNPPSFDILSLARSKINQGRQQGKWALAISTNRKSWDSAKDEVDSFKVREISPLSSDSSEAFKSSSTTSILAPIFEALTSQWSFSDRQQQEEVTAEITQKSLLLNSTLTKINQLLDSVNATHLLNLSSLAQRLVSKIFGLRLAHSTEQIQLPGTTTIVWYVRIYLDVQCSDLTSVQTLSTNVVALDEATSIFIQDESAAAGEILSFDQAAWLSTSCPFSQNTTSSLTRYRQNILQVQQGSNNNKSTVSSSPSSLLIENYPSLFARYVFTGCAARDFSKKMAETKAIYRFLCANFNPEVFTHTAKMSTKFIDLLQNEKPELWSAAKNISVQQELDTIRSEAKVVMTERKNDRVQRDTRREQKAAAYLDKLPNKHPQKLFSAQQQQHLLQGSSDETNEFKSFDRESRRKQRDDEYRKENSRNAPPKLHHNSLSEEQRQLQADAIRRFKKGSQFDKIEQDNYLFSSSSPSSSSMQQLQSNKQVVPSFGDDENNQDNGEEDFSTPSKKSKSQQNNSNQLDATPLKNVLRAALRDERHEELRVRETKFGSQGITVTIYSIPLNEDDTLDLTGEVELGVETEINGQKALALLCYRILQEKFPERLIAAVSENPNLLDSVLG